MNLPSFSLKRRVTTFMIYIAVAIFGFMSFTTLPIDLMPSIEIPVAIISTTYSGAGSEEIETLVTKPLEQAIATISSIDTITSSSSEGSSMVIAIFVDDTDMDNALVEMREKVDLISPYLPSDSSTPIVMGIDLDSMPVVQFSISGDTSLANLEQIAEDNIIPSVERVENVASVTSSGGYENIVRIDTDTEKIRGLGLTISQISQTLQAQNISLPSGEINYGDKELTVRTDGEFTSIDDIKDTLITLSSGATIKLSEIATVNLVPDDITSVAKVNGEQVISISVSKQSGSNTSAVSKDVIETINELKVDYPDLEFTTLLDQSEYVDLAINSVLQNVILGIIFAVFVLFLFFRRIAPTLIIAISMPMCIIGTFLIMKGLDLTLNTLTLGAMAIGVGMIVDNSVVVLENIYRFIEKGYPKFEACLKGSKEVALSITASTATTVAVFLPIGLSGGTVGQIFKSFSLTIASLLIASLLIALTLVPLLCYIFLNPKKIIKKDKPTKRKKVNFILLGYQKVLKSAVKHPIVSLLTTIVIFSGLMGSLVGSSVELIPSSDQSMISISVSLPVTSQLSDATKYAEEITSRIIDTPELDNTYYTAEGNSVSIVMNLIPAADRERSVFIIADEVRNAVSNIAGAEISVSDAGAMDMSSLTGDAISVSISGSDLDVLTAISSDLVTEIAKIEGAVDVSSSATERVEQVNLRLKNDIAAKYGLTAYTLSTEVSANLSGVTATQLKSDGTEIDVVVKGDESSKASLSALQNLLVNTPMGTVPLNMVADVTIELGPNTIVRENQVRTITITGDSYDVDSLTLTEQVNAIIDNYDVPDGYFIDAGGEWEETLESFNSLFYSLIVAICLVYFVLASQFESILLPFIIMLAMPLGLSGGLFGLTITDMPISMPAFIGVIMLSGIVVNNSIVLIDYIRLREEEGEDRITAIATACPLRVRPVLMTTLTTILGLIPMALGIGGEGSEMMIPMAVVMISGLAISTIVTLFVSPVLYYVLKGGKRGLKKQMEARSNV